MPQNLFSRRVLATGAAGAVALCMAAAGSVPASAAPDPGHHREGPEDPARSVASALRLMSTQEKVGQLFVQNVYGSDATTPGQPATSRCTASPRPAEVVRKYHLGGVIYFAWTDSVKDPDQIAGLSNGLQKARSCGSGRRASRCRSPPTRSRASSPGSGRRPRSSPARWRSAPAQRRRRPHRRGDHRPRAARRWASTPTSRPDCRRQRQPAQPGDRHPVLLLRPGARRLDGRGRPGRRLPADAGVVVLRPSTSRATATPRPTATPASRSSPTPASSGSRSTRRRSRPRSTAGIDMIMTAHLVVPGARPLGRPGDAEQADPDGHAARASSATRASSSPTPWPCRACGTSTATPRSPCGPCWRASTSC